MTTKWTHMLVWNGKAPSMPVGAVAVRCKSLESAQRTAKRFKGQVDIVEIKETK